MSDCLRRLWSEAYVTRGLDDATHRSITQGLVLLSALLLSDRMWTPKVFRRSWGLAAVVHGDPVLPFCTLWECHRSTKPSHETYSARVKAAKKFFQAKSI